MMKKVVFALAVVVALSVRADDSYLYWMAGAIPSQYDYKTVNLVAMNSDTWSWSADKVYLTPEGASDGGVTMEQVVDVSAMSDALISNVSGVDNAWTFFVELLDGGSILAYSDGLSYAAASSYMNSGSQFDIASANTWTTSSFTATPIPEPTSGMMVLLGMVVLALRRRRV